MVSNCKYVFISLFFFCLIQTITAFTSSLILKNYNKRINKLSHLTIFGVSKKYSDVLKIVRNDQPKILSFEKNEIDTTEDFSVVESIVKAADDRKAIDIVVLGIQGVSDITDYVIIMEGNSKPQTQAILNSVEEQLITSHNRRALKSGDAASGWIVLDYGSIMVHIMLPKMRNFYKIERKWKDAKLMDMSHVLSDRSTSDALEEFEDEDKDPFWDS